VDVIDGAGGELLALLAVESPDLGAGEVLELAVSERGLEVVFDDALGADVGVVRHLASPHEGLEAVRESRVHPLPGLEVVRVEDEALVGVRAGLVELLRSLQNRGKPHAAAGAGPENPKDD
jgi:hypothetical protein